MITAFLWEIPCYNSTMCSKNTLFPTEASIVWRNPCFAIPPGGKPVGLGIFSAPDYYQYLMEMQRGYSWKRDRVAIQEKGKGYAEEKTGKDVTKMLERNGYPRVNGGRNESITGKMCPCPG